MTYTVTRIYYRRLKSGRYYLSKLSGPRFIEVKAVWREITVALWEKITEPEYLQDEPPSPINQEERAWKHLLLDTSLWKDYRGQKLSDNQVTDEALKYIQDFMPPALLRILVLDALATAYVTKEEEEKIKHQCRVLWLGRGSKINDAHPMLADAIQAMSMAERYKMSRYDNYGQIPQKLATVMRLAAAMYGEMLDQNQQMRNLQDMAAREAGLRGASAQQAMENQD